MNNGQIFLLLVFIIVSKNGSTEIIDQLIVLHGILCDTTILINKAFGGPTLFVAISCLIHLIITSYFLYNADSTRSMFVLTLQVLWIIFHTFRLYLVVQPCYLVSTKVSFQCRICHFSSIIFIGKLYQNFNVHIVESDEFSSYSSQNL